jgi:uncharacterized Zn-finger protein
MPSVPPPPETVFTSTNRVACDGATEISPALGHPRVYLQIAELGYADCGYCDKRFILKGGPADNDPAILGAPDAHNK